MRFTKMHGSGNDYVCVDGFLHALPENPFTMAISVSDRRTGVGSDGLILICPSAEADAEMRMFNADGSPAEMCGNGIRCVAKYLFDRGMVRQPVFTVATAAGIRTLEVFPQAGKVHQVRVDMGVPELRAEFIPTLLRGEKPGPVANVPLEVGCHKVRVTCVSMGNPHCVVYVDDLATVPRTTSELDDVVTNLGPQIERHPIFPARVNVEFVTVHSTQEVHQRTWERGSGETWACGTGASAVCVAGVLTGRTGRQLTCHLRGGALQLEWDEATNSVFMTGPAVEVFQGEFPSGSIA